jgi:hypothetical protein
MGRSITRRFLLAAGFLGLGAVSPAGAQSEKPILTISGKVNGDKGPVVFDRAALEQLGTIAIETTTPWHTGKVRFEGVPMAVLMKTVGASGTVVEAHALNDYSTVIPAEDFAKHNVILAIRKDGEYMPVRDKGPLFIVYPYDSDPDLKSQKYYGRSAWQVKELKVK